MQVAEILELLAHTDVADIDQAKTVANALQEIIDDSNEPEPDPEEQAVTVPTNSNDQINVTKLSTASDSAGKAKLRKILTVADMLMSTQVLKEVIMPTEFEIRFKAAGPVGDVLSNKGSFKGDWIAMNGDPSTEGAQPHLQSLQKYLLYLIERREEVLDKKGLSGEYNKTLSGGNLGADILKTSTDGFKRKAEGATGYFSFPDWNGPHWKGVVENWGEVPDVFAPNENAKIPTDIFADECQGKQVSFVGTIMDTFPDEGKKNPR